jgi:predicted Zn-dependent protease
VVLLVIIAYVLLGVATEVAVARVPVKAEVWIGEHFIGRMEALESKALKQRVDKLVEALPEDSPLREYDFSVQMVESEEINALALPGGHIVVFTGLIEQADSENEVAMVLAHELGHFANRDHLRRLGRGLSLAVGAFLLFGDESATGDLINRLFLVSESHYSREQESAADRFGLDLLVASYGHAGGATDFFTRVGNEAGHRAPYLLASHPHPQARIDELEGLIDKFRYRVEETTSLAEDLLSELPEDDEKESEVEEQSF